LLRLQSLHRARSPVLHAAVAAARRRRRSDGIHRARGQQRSAAGGRSGNEHPERATRRLSHICICHVAQQRSQDERVAAREAGEPRLLSRSLARCLLTRRSNRTRRP
jgi:hypothetical protein